MNFEQAINAIEEQNVIHLRVEDSNKKRILALDMATATELAKKINEYKDSLSSYGKVTFVCATEKVFNASWRDALNWQVVFNNTVQTNNNLPIQSGIVPPGYVSASEAMLQSKLAELTLKAEFEKRFADLEKQTSVKPSTADEIFKFMPILGLFMDIDATKMQSMLGLATLSASMNNTTPGTTQQPGISGLNDKVQTIASVETTTAENETLDKIENELVELTSKVPMQDLLLLISTLNKKPELVATLKGMIPNT